MPRGDGTGPLGLGPRTGRAMGYCAGYPTPGYMNPGFGFGFGLGFRRFWRRGFGRGFGGRGFGLRRWRFVPIIPSAQPQVWEPVQVQPQVYQPTKEQELQMLEDERKVIEQEMVELREEMENIKKRIKELNK